MEMPESALTHHEVIDVVSARHVIPRSRLVVHQLVRPQRIQRQVIIPICTATFTVMCDPELYINNRLHHFLLVK